jgi:hypothetical protein
MRVVGDTITQTGDLGDEAVSDANRPSFVPTDGLRELTAG